ncbi:hypothetical protein BDR06DRAFT_707734 [Suillus hirtellus]|nr:hypothetical protein BDR06DRAFT_707734 [Suillus hirtellus]
MGLLIVSEMHDDLTTWLESVQCKFKDMTECSPDSAFVSISLELRIDDLGGRIWVKAGKEK